MSQLPNRPTDPAAIWGVSTGGPAWPKLMTTKHHAVLQPDREQILLHQVHYAKLGTDVGAAVLSTVLVWRGHIRIGLVLRYLLPTAASIALVTRNLSSLRKTRRGRYVLAHMTPGAQAVRLLGDVVMTIGAVRRRPSLVFLGFDLVVIGWMPWFSIPESSLDVGVYGPAQLLQ
jgi:hypothetical protein